MQLTELRASRFRSLHEFQLDIGRLNLLIGANAAGKSNVLDALRFLADALRGNDFEPEVLSRGGLLHLAWKGDPANAVELRTIVRDEHDEFDWRVSLARTSGGFETSEELYKGSRGKPPEQLLAAEAGQGWWWSEAAGQKVNLEVSPTRCSLAAAAADASFPGRSLAEFVSRWGFFDPSPTALRRASDRADSARLDPIGKNLASRLLTLRNERSELFREIIEATRSILGVPTEIEFVVSEDQDRVFFLQNEPGLRFRVHQVGASSGTLRILALLTALFGESEASLVGIEEPENHIHPAALKDFASHLLSASKRVQVLVTTHSPLLLDYLGTPEAVCVVRRTEGGTRASRETHPDAVKEALEESGFGLGEFHETKGFGG